MMQNITQTISEYLMPFFRFQPIKPT